jgi:hypothetical protein
MSFTSVGASAAPAGVDAAAGPSAPSAATAAITQATMIGLASHQPSEVTFERMSLTSFALPIS